MRSMILLIALLAACSSESPQAVTSDSTSVVRPPADSENHGDTEKAEHGKKHRDHGESKP